MRHIGQYIGQYVGILLLMLSVAGLIYWETSGRDRVWADEIIIASRNIPPGTVIEADMLTTIRIPKKAEARDVYLAGDEAAVVGHRTAWPLFARQQVTPDFFTVSDEETEAGEACFVIPAEWIAMRSSALRGGDTVEILSANAGEPRFGTFRVAFVKDEQEKEVRDPLRDETLRESGIEPRDRADGDSRVDHVEIITTERTYFDIRAYAAGRAEPSLILIQRKSAK